MKNSHNEFGWPSGDKPRGNGPVPSTSPAEQSMMEHTVFSTPPALRIPETPEVESLRSLLKANLPSEKASQALLERIRCRVHDLK